MALEVFPEDWERGLAVVAHPDDMEYGAAAAVARWTEQGKQFAYVLVSDGEAGIASMDPAEAGPVRRREQEASCAVVGVDEVTFLGWADGAIVEGLELRADLAAEIRRHRPEVVVSINFRDSWGPGELEPRRPPRRRPRPPRCGARRGEPVGVLRSWRPVGRRPARGVQRQPRADTCHRHHGHVRCRRPIAERSIARTSRTSVATWARRTDSCGPRPRRPAPTSVSDWPTTFEIIVRLIG